MKTTELDFPIEYKSMVEKVLKAIGIVYDTSLMQDSISYYDVIVYFTGDVTLIASTDLKKFCYY
jgi:hypothetical protein